MDANGQRRPRLRTTAKRPVIAENARANFGAGFYVDANGQRRPMYRMTAKGPHGRANFGESSYVNTQR